MPAARRSVLHQSFLPTDGDARAFVWKYSPTGGGRRPRHFHAEPELNLIVRGSALFGVGDTTVRVSAGELLGFPPGQDHALLEASPDLYLYAIGVDPNFSSEVLRGDRHNVALPMRVRLAASDFNRLSAGAGAIVDREGVDQNGAELWEQAHWLRRRYLAHENPTHVLTRRAMVELCEEPSLGLAALAKRLRSDPSEISRYFHRDLGLTFVQYRARMRLLRFIALSDQNTDNLLSCAQAAGFGSYSQCHRVFQAELGCGPRQFLIDGQRQTMQLAYAPSP